MRCVRSEFGAILVRALAEAGAGCAGWGVDFRGGDCPFVVEVIIKTH